jgi:hypothetical protein
MKHWPSRAIKTKKRHAQITRIAAMRSVPPRYLRGGSDFMGLHLICGFDFTQTVS